MINNNPTIFHFQPRPRLNRPPLAGRAKLSTVEPSKDLQHNFRATNHIDTHSSNASCDTTFDESLSMCSREAYSLTSLNISHYSEMAPDGLEVRSMDCLDTAEKRENGQDEIANMLNTTHQKKKTPTDEAKYKTEMCKKWTETNQCPYGRKCKFAHGRHELNQKLLNNRSVYRSKKCNSFHTSMTCPYGIRCQFAHEQRPLDELLTTSHYERFVACPELLENSDVLRRKRLPVFLGVKGNKPSVQRPDQVHQEKKKTFNGDPSVCLYGWQDYEEFHGLDSRFQKF